MSDTTSGVRKLKRADDNRASKRTSERLKAIKLRNTGMSLQAIATTLGRHVNTVRRWIHLFDAGGIDQLKYRHKGGRARKLSDAHNEMLASWLNEGAASGSRWTLRKLAEKLATESGVIISQQQISEAVAQLGLSHHLSRPRRNESRRDSNG